MNNYPDAEYPLTNKDYVPNCHKVDKSHWMTTDNSLCRRCGWCQPADIALALKDHDRINASKDRWASLEILQFEHMRVVRLTIGDIHIGGQKQCYNVKREYRVDDNGVVHYYDHVYP
jgi:hypothetical protein